MRFLWGPGFSATVVSAQLLERRCTYHLTADDKANISPPPGHVGLPARFSSWDELSERICWSTIKIRNQEGPCWRSQMWQINSEVRDPRDCSLPVASVCGILPARILEWVVIHFSMGSSWPKDRTWVSCIAGRLFTIWTTKEALIQRKSLLSSWIKLYTINSCHHPDLAFLVMGSVSSWQILKDFTLFIDSISA